MEQDSIHGIVRQAEQNLLEGNTKIGEHVSWSLHDTIETVFAYVNSKHISGDTDSLGRDKPFFNIVSAAVNIWYRATDIDRKDIVVLPDKAGNVAGAFLATILLQDWMKKTNFGVFLNQWGRVLAQYGSAVVKFVEKNGELIPTVIPWNRLIVDPIDFEALPRIEKFYKTPAQLKNMATKGHKDYAGYDFEIVNSLLDSQQSRENLQGEQMDNQSDFIELYEVHGELSQAVYKTGKGQDDIVEKDNEVFFQQMHVVSWCTGKDGKNIDFTLFCGKEKKDPYMLTHLIEEEGRTLSIGAVEYLFDAQWMTNHTMKQWKDQMDLASKLVFQTSDTNYVGKNVLTNIETGDIMIHGDNKPLTMMPNTGHDITNLQAFANQWKILSQEITSTPDAVRGNTLPSGTPYSLGAYTGAQALSLFEVMTENKGLAIEDMLRTFVIPHLLTKIDTKDEVTAILEDHDIKKLEGMYVPRMAIKNYNKEFKEALLKGEMPTEFNQPQAEQGVKESLAQMGNQTFFSPGDITWKEVVKDLEWKLDVQVTNEQQDKQAVLGTLSSVLQTIATNPLALQDPNAKMVFNKILSFSGQVSPIELSPVAPPPPAPPLAPQS
jgi:hypothetical protein